MVLNQSCILVEFTLPVDDDLYRLLKIFDPEELNYIQKEKLYSNNFNFSSSNSNNDNCFKVDVLIPKNYKNGNKTCLFIHGSGSSRLSTRNRFIANHLVDMNICCCLMNLFTIKEKDQDNITGNKRFDINLLTSRVINVINFLLNINHLTHSNYANYINIMDNFEIVKKYLDIIPNNKMILFGSSTGAAAALYSAFFKRDVISGIISRGGRPDLVPLYIIKNFPCYKKKNEKDSLVPVLFIVGSKDKYITPLNEDTFLKLGTDIESREQENDIDCFEDYKVDLKKIIHNRKNNNSINSDNEFIKVNNYYKKQWKWIENASHLFEEAGAIDKVLYCTKKWIENLD